jgi:arylsulfatase
MKEMPSDERPNFLIFLPDQHRYDWLSVHQSARAEQHRPAAKGQQRELGGADGGTNVGLPVRTPVIDRLAARGVRFTRAITPSPLCAPARACLASGKEYDHCRVASNTVDYPLDQPTYYQALREAGYRVCGVGKFDLHKATLDWGLAGDRLLREWGFTEGIDNEGKLDAIASATAGGTLEPKGPYMAYLHRRGLAGAHVADFRARRNRGTDPTPLPDDAYCDNWLAANGLRFLERFPRGRPWHLVVNFTGPHSPFDVTAAMRARWQDVPFPPPIAAPEDGSLTLAEHVAIRQNYAAMIENIDRLCGRFLEVVEARGELDRTVVIYSSDHGEMLGDHGRWGKSIYYQPSVGIPLIVAGPDIQSGVVSDALVSLHDLTATLLELAGVPPLPEMDSRSLLPVLRGERRSHREVVRSGLGGWRMAFDGRYKLVRDEQEGTLLFDLENDPTELRNLAADRPEVVARLRPSLTPDGAAG